MKYSNQAFSSVLEDMIFSTGFNNINGVIIDNGFLSRETGIMKSILNTLKELNAKTPGRYDGILPRKRVEFSDSSMFDVSLLYLKKNKNKAYSLYVGTRTYCIKGSGSGNNATFCIMDDNAIFIETLDGRVDAVLSLLYFGDCRGMKFYKPKSKLRDFIRNELEKTDKGVGDRYKIIKTLQKFSIDFPLLIKNGEKTGIKLVWVLNDCGNACGLKSATFINLQDTKVHKHMGGKYMEVAVTVPDADSFCGMCELLFGGNING